MLEVVLDHAANAASDDRGDGDGEDDGPVRVHLDEQRRDRRVGPGQGHDRERRGPQAVTIGRAASGTASVSRAAQMWNGMAPNRIATARAKAR